MMFHLPYWSMPFNGRYSRYGYRYPTYNYSSASSSFATKTTPHYGSNVNNVYPKHDNFYKSSNKNCFGNSTSKDKINIDNDNNKENCSNADDDSPLFQLFGINLYFDDILLICLIWFLYDEGVKDEGLFMALILLLLS